MDREGKTGVIASGGIVECEMMKTAGEGWPRGVSLKQMSVILAAQILVIEDNDADVFLLVTLKRREPPRQDAIPNCVCDCGEKILIAR